MSYLWPTDSWTSANLSQIDVDSMNAFYTMWNNMGWLAEGQPNTPSYILLAKVYEFLKTVDNVNTAAPQLAEMFGTTERRVWLMFDWYGGLEYGGPEFWATIVWYAHKTTELLGHPLSKSWFVPAFIVLALISAFTTGVRFWSRLSINGRLRSYDWLLGAAWIITIAFGLMQAVATKTFASHLGAWDHSGNDYISNSATSFAYSILYAVCVILVKSSLLLFYHQLTAWLPLRIATYVTFFVVVCANLAYLFGNVFRCNPVIAWRGDAYFTYKGCPVDLTKLEIAVSSVNIISDVLIWALPLPMVWKIVKSNRERVFAVITFGIGSVACIACGLRMRFILEGYKWSVLNPQDANVFSFYTQLELNLAIVCASIPALRALAIKKMPSLIGSKGSTEGSNEKASKDHSGIHNSQDKPGINVGSYSVTSEDRSNSPV